MKIQDYPAEIERASLELHQTQAQINQRREAIKERELACYGEVAYEREQLGKRAA